MRMQVFVVGYVRMSTDQQETSPEQQRTEIERYAAKKGWRIARWYQDHGISGDRTEQRVEFLQMVSDGASGGIDAIITWDLSRFGRFDSVEAGYYIHPLRKAGVRLETVVDGLIDWNDMTGRMMSMLQTEAKHQLLADTSRSISRKLGQKAEAGEWRSGPAPFGFVIGDDQKLHHGAPEEVDTVRALFRRYLAGSTLRELAQWLNDRGVRSTRGRSFSNQTVSSILHNPAYIGRVEYRRTSVSKYRQHNPGRKQIKHDPSKWIVVEDSHEAIVDVDTFNAVQERLTSNRKMTGPKGPSGGFAFKGLVSCAKCGSPMRGWNQLGKRNYLCAGYSTDRSCDRLVVSEHELLRQVLAVLREQVFDPLGRQGRKQIMQAMQRELTHITSRREIDLSLLTKLESRLSQAQRRLSEVSPDMVAHVETRIREIESEIAAIQARDCSDETPSFEIVERRINRAMAWLDNIESIADADYDPRKLRELIGQFVTRVNCYVHRVPMKPGSRKHVCRLTGGEIYVKPAGFGFSVMCAFDSSSSKKMT